MNTETVQYIKEIRKLHPIQEAMILLGGISRTTFYSLAKTGRIQIVKIGSRSFVTQSSIEVFIEQLANVSDEQS
ncbi:putative DNA-binding transcriptional regulator AlpA [Aurantimicrobium minutum]|uniref:helix-turn-helix domain-containing protein n=1 Tax=Aurantimicrobium minutum TaxID=708131 RepID=UPI0024766D76|nr:helix-turn-helix domain-containing protein [Aurantimicrobium minutum]MDH6410052.1 putative DNA-binding transcriptional regulator AlpA [Aurantimicrobium minutum]